MVPDYLVPLNLGVPFFKSCFDFFCNHFDKGPCVLAAPYCSSPPSVGQNGEERVFAFKWATNRNDKYRRQIALEAMSREEGAVRTGFENVVAAATGLMMIDTRIVDTKLKKPWFEYEWKDPPFNTQKASTEDVYFTRNCSLVGIPVYVNWDAWAAHAKSEIVGKPMLMTNDELVMELRETQNRNRLRGEKLMELNPEKSTDEILKDLGLEDQDVIADDTNP
jgi:hypothetical protein